MSEWDFEEQGADRRQAKGAPKKGPLNVWMAVCCLLAVAAVSFLTAGLMKDHARNVWEMGLTFLLPFAALMGTSMAVERATGRMTPQCSRKAQLLCAGVTMAAAFLFGCFTETFHQPVIVEKAEPEYDYILVLDKSGSMVFTDLDEPCREACHGLIESMEDENRVGIVAFGYEVVGSAPIQPLDGEHRNRISDIIGIPVKMYEDGSGDGTNFSAAMDEAARLIEGLEDEGRPVRIILVTDGDSDSHGDFSSFTPWAKAKNDADPERKRVELCAVQIGPYPMLKMVKDAVAGTGGTVYDGVSSADLAAQLLSMKKTELIPEPVDTLKATYSGQTSDGEPKTPYMILSCVMLILLGALSGISLRIMYSVQGQRRAQVYLSTAMGLTAFLLLNFGRMLGISPAWICEALAFSLFGLVFMRENPEAAQGSARPSGTQKQNPVPGSPPRNAGQPEPIRTPEQPGRPAGRRARNQAQGAPKKGDEWSDSGSPEPIRTPEQPGRPAGRRARNQAQGAPKKGDEWSDSGSSGSSDEWM